MRYALIFSLLAFPAFAQDGLRPSDTVLSQSEMADLLTGQQLEFFDGSKSRYGDDGRYGYTYTDDGPVWEGQYDVFDESRVCVDFDNGSRRCDMVIRADQRLVLITEDGLRFPVRNRTVYLK